MSWRFIEVNSKDFSKKQVEELKSTVLDVIDKYQKKFFEINFFLYKNPEVGYEEFKATNAFSRLGLLNICSSFIVSKVKSRKMRLTHDDP